MKRFVIKLQASRFSFYWKWIFSTCTFWGFCLPFRNTFFKEHILFSALVIFLIKPDFVKIEFFRLTKWSFEQIFKRFKKVRMAYKISCRLVNQKIFYMMSLVGDELRLVKSIHIFLSESNAMKINGKYKTQALSFC